MERQKMGAIAGAMVLGGAFVITMAGGQFFATKKFMHFTQINNQYITEAVAWLSAISCSYVMTFTRGQKIYKGLRKNAAEKDTDKAPLSLPGKIIASLGGLSGVLRSILLGYIGTYGLMTGVGIKSLLAIALVAIYVCISNTISYLKFTLATAIDNSEFIVKFFTNRSSDPDSSTQIENGTRKKIISIVITLPALIGAFAYFNFLSYSALKSIPYLPNYLSNSAMHWIAATVTGLTIITGGLAKGVQYYKYLTGQEDNQISAQQLAKTHSPLTRSHQGVGLFYTLFYLIVTFIGLMSLAQNFNIIDQAAIPVAALIAIPSAILEYAFSVRIMVNSEKASLLKKGNGAALSPLLATTSPIYGGSGRAAINDDPGTSADEMLQPQ